MPDGIEEVGGRMPQGFNMEMYKFGVVDGRMRERADWRKSGERYVGVKHIRVCRRLKSAIHCTGFLLLSANLIILVSL